MMREFGSAKRLPLLPAASKNAPMLAASPMHKRRHVGLDELHRVVDRQAGADAAARRVDVQRDVLVGVLALEEQQLRDDEVGRLVVHRADQEDHALAQQAAVDVVSAFAAAGLLDDDGHHAQALVFPTRSWGSFGSHVLRLEETRLCCLNIDAIENASGFVAPSSWPSARRTRRPCRSPSLVPVRTR